MRYRYTGTYTGSSIRLVPRPQASPEGVDIATHSLVRNFSPARNSVSRHIIFLNSSRDSSPSPATSCDAIHFWTSLASTYTPRPAAQAITSEAVIFPVCETSKAAKAVSTS